MPNYTDNLGLIQPLGSEKIRIAQINQNMDTLDEAVGAVGDKSLQQQILDIGGGIAIMANNNTHPAITAGQFVFVRNHSTLADGAYTANSNIAENATLSSSNLTAVPGGGFNALKAGIASLSDHFDTKTSYVTAFDAPVNTQASALHFYADRIGRTIYYDVVFVLTSAVTANTQIAHVTNLSNGMNVHVSAIGSNGSAGRFLITTSGTITCENNLPANEYFSFSSASLYNASIT